MLRIDVSFDLICPWCWIGKGNLEQALARWAQSEPGAPVQVAWHGVQLLPQVPPEGLPFEAFYIHRLGSAQAVRDGSAQQHEALVERLFQAHFVEGRDIGDSATLVALAEDCAIDADLAREADADTQPFESSAAHAHAGVPHFVFNRRWSLSGAHPPSVLLQAMHQALPQPLPDEESI